MPEIPNEAKKGTSIFSKPYTFSPAEAIAELKSDAKKGLSSADAKERLDQFGPNEIPEPHTSFWKVYIAPISNWLINIYLLAALSIFCLTLTVPTPFTLSITGEVYTKNDIYITLIPWFVAIGANALIAVVQQYRGQKKLEALQQLMAQQTTVIRDGEKKKIRASEVVPGDILLLSQGNKVPADSLLLESYSLVMQEASLTGEAKKINKEASQSGLKGTVPVYERTNMVFMGTYATKGSAKCLVVNTGSNTIMGKLSRDLEKVTTGDILIRKKVNVLAKYLGIAVLILLGLSIMAKMFTLWRFVPSILWGDVVHVLINSIILALTVMPINIVLLVTIVLLTGVLAMAKKNVIVRDLSAIESLGRVSVICSDKTGTITENKMMVKRVWDCKHLYGVTGTGFSKKGSIVQMEDDPTARIPKNGVEPIKNLSKPLKSILVNCFLNTEAQVKEDGILGDPTDGACKILFYKSPLDEEEILSRYEIVAEFPFDSKLKRMSRACKQPHSNSNVILTKGATEVVLDRCTKIFRDHDTVNLTNAKKKKIRSLVNKFAEQGYRVISFAYKEVDALPEKIDTARDQLESNLVYAGFVCIVDPPRPGVKEAVRDCQSAGIEVTMITGDSSLTAESIAKEVNILTKKGKHQVREGHEIDELDEKDFQNTRAFARVNPKDKQKLVKRYQDQGRIVAMTGDGVNDALAVSMSDCGIAMGKEGTDVTKQASDVVITDDAFPSIRTGVEEGRNLFAKIRKMCFFYITINVMEAITLFGLLFMLGSSNPAFKPFLNAQLQWFTVTSHTFPAFALILDKKSHTVMQEAPRDTEEIINLSLFKMLLLNALLAATGALIVYLLSYFGIYPVFSGNLRGVVADNLSLQKARTMVACILIFAESLSVLSIRRLNLSIIESHKGEEFAPRIYVFLALIFLGTVGLIYVPAAQRLVKQFTAGAINFELMWLTAVDWLVISLAVLPSLLGLELYKRYKRTKGERF